MNKMKLNIVTYPTKENIFAEHSKMNYYVASKDTGAIEGEGGQQE